MSDEAAIRKAVQKLAGVSNNMAKIVAATVTSVDMVTRTCAVTTITGKSEIDISAVQIMPDVSDGFILVPAVGSLVYIAYSIKNLPFIQMFSEIDRVILICDNVQVNDGSYGGLIKIIDQTSKLNNLVNQLTAELVKIEAGIVAAGGTYTPGTLDQFNKTDYENTMFKHGQ